MSDTIHSQENHIPSYTFTSSNEVDPTTYQTRKILERVADMLDEKNKAYGDSALNPVRIFSQADAVGAIKVRIDDKLSRIKNQGLTSDSEDTILDLIGYLALLKVGLDQ